MNYIILSFLQLTILFLPYLKKDKPSVSWIDIDLTLFFFHRTFSFQTDIKKSQTLNTVCINPHNQEQCQTKLQRLSSLM